MLTIALVQRQRAERHHEEREADLSDQHAVDQRPEQRPGDEGAEDREPRREPEVVEAGGRGECPSARASSPTDRSIPAVSTTNVMPIETTKRIETLVRRFSMFGRVKKFSWVSERTTKIDTRRISTAAYRLDADQAPAA